MARGRERLRRSARGLGWLARLGLASALLWLGVGPASASQPNSCETCHANPDFLVTNKKLYDYYQQWNASVHKQEGVTCDDCHGGNPRATDARTAHGAGVKETDPSSGIYYKNVPKTCGGCHEDVLSGFRKSNHYRHLEKKQSRDEQGPTCVTCHGSINSEILNVNNVAAACARCHNEKTKNHPENPEKAQTALNRFLSIQRFYRYIGVHAEANEGREFFRQIDPKIEHLSVTWHTFDLKAIDKATNDVLGELKAKRDEIHKRAETEKSQGGSSPN
jgi:hypothetical protein